MKKPKIKNLIPAIIVGLSYPVIKYFASESNKMLAFLDSLTIMGLVFLVVGILFSIYLHGDLDALIFRMRHPNISQETSFDTFRKNKEKEREDSFNYPLLTGILFIAASFILANCCY